MKNLLHLTSLLLIFSLVGCEKITPKTPEVTKDREELKLEITPKTAISFKANDNAPYQIMVNTNLDTWWVVVDQAWCHITQNASSVALTVDNNELAEPRTASITVSGKGVTNKVLTITQAAAVIVPIGDLFSFELPDFSKSYVYNVIENGVKIAEICREYLYKEGELDVQVVTVYLNGTDKVADLTNGFIAKITQKGEIDNSAIVGGTVSFDSKTNSITKCTNGNLQPTNSITINLKDKSIGFTAAAAPGSSPESAPTIAALTPYQVADADQNQYPIVKIATQYWMAENMRTTKRNDGTPIKNANTSKDWVKSADDRTGAYSAINNEQVNTATYGLLYNAYAMGYTNGYSDLTTDKISPQGWKLPAGWKLKVDERYVGVIHVPESDMDRMMRYLQGSVENGAAPKMHSTETWTARVKQGVTQAQPYGNNISLFSAKGAGFCSFDLLGAGYEDGSFQQFKHQEGWWCSTAPIPSSEGAVHNQIEVGYIDGTLSDLNASYQHQGLGLSVRCLRK